MDKHSSERRIRRTLTENHITPISALLSSEFGLLRLGDLTDRDAKSVIEDAARSVLRSKFLRATKIEGLDQQRYKQLSSGCKQLDAFLGGGFAVQGITEIAGSSGCGKTQLCLQLLLTAQIAEELGGLKSGAVYICTEEAFPSQRLQQLIQTFPKQGIQDQSPFGDNIFIEHVAEVDQLEHCVKERLPNLISQRKIGLIVIDSIAGVFRSSYNLEDCPKRAESLRVVGNQLHFLAHKHNICVVCINQVTAKMNSTSTLKNTAPALGLAWANLVTTRLSMWRSDPGSNIIVRSLEILFSPYLPNRSINFVVTEEGVKGIS